MPVLAWAAAFAATAAAVAIAALTGLPEPLGLGATIPLMLLAGLFLGSIVGGSWLLFDNSERPVTDLGLQIMMGLIGATATYLVILMNNSITVVSVGFATIVSAWVGEFLALVVTPWLDRGVTILSESIYS